MSPFYSSEWLSRLKPHIKHDIYRQGSVESAPFMWGGERLQGWAFKAMSLNCILAKWDEWCFLIRLLTGFCVVKIQRWCLIVNILNDMLLVQLSLTLAIFKCILALIWHLWTPVWFHLVFIVMSCRDEFRSVTGRHSVTVNGYTLCLIKCYVQREKEFLVFVWSFTEEWDLLSLFYSEI